MDTFYEKGCSICNHSEVHAINELLLVGDVSQKEIAQTFTLSEPSLSIHKNRHVIIDVKAKVKEIMLRALTKKLDCKSVTELYQIASLYEKLEERNCDVCEYRITAMREKKGLGEAIAEYLNSVEDGEA